MLKNLNHYTILLLLLKKNKQKPPSLLNFIINLNDILILNKKKTKQKSQIFFIINIKMGSQNGKQSNTMTHQQSSSIKKKIKSKDTLNSSFGTTNYEDRISAGEFIIIYFNSNCHF